MIFTNPAGAPELACDACGCRWFDRMSAPGRSVFGTCYECGAEVSAESQAEFRQALADFASRARAAPRPCPGPLDGATIA